MLSVANCVSYFSYFSSEFNLIFNALELLSGVNLELSCVVRFEFPRSGKSIFPLLHTYFTWVINKVKFIPPWTVSSPFHIHNTFPIWLQVDFFESVISSSWDARIHYLRYIEEPPYFSPLSAFTFSPWVIQFWAWSSVSFNQNVCQFRSASCRM